MSKFARSFRRSQSGCESGSALSLARASTWTSLQYSRMHRSRETNCCRITCYKDNERAAIEAEGYTIIANIGDQWSDLDPQEGDPTKEVIEKGPYPTFGLRLISTR
jgi:hypothetical protein